MHRVWMVWSILGLSLAMCGCQNSTPPAQSTEPDGKAGATTEGAQNPGAPPTKPNLTVLEGVDSFEGNWVLSPAMSNANRHLWLFQLSKNDADEWTIQDLANDPLIGKIIGQEIKIDGSKILLTAETENPKAQIKNAKISFEGTMQDGQVFGNVLIGDTPQYLPARLFPTDAVDLENYVPFLREEGASEFEKASQEPDPAHVMWNLAKKYPKTSMALNIYTSLFAQIEKWNYTEDEARSAANDFMAAAAHWGPRLEGQLEIDAGLSFARHRKFLALAEELLKTGETHAVKNAVTEEKLKAGDINLRIIRGLSALRVENEDQEAAQRAYEDFQQLLTVQLYHPEILLALAEYARQTNKIDDAINYYLILVSVPSLERMALKTRIGVPADDDIPRRALLNLWKEKHGSLDGLEAAVGATYDRENEFLFNKLKETAPAIPSMDEGNRTLLIEQFTGTSCEPCVALDLVLSSLLKEMSPTRVVQLSYHQHLPAADPLTCFDGDARGKFYTLEGTPALFMNGAAIDHVGGPFLANYIEQNYYVILGAISHFLKMSTDVKIESSAVVEAEKLNVKISVTGIPEDAIEKVRLRVAIAEENVEFTAPNGIRHHHMVVRTMLGGPGGKAANKDHVLEYQIAMPIVELKARQISYLNQMEHAHRVQFPKKPVEMKHLYLVCFVQHENTREVFQAAATRIEGELIYPEMRIDPSSGTLIIEPTNAPTDETTPKEEPAKEPASSETPDAEKPQAEPSQPEKTDSEKAESEKPAAESN